MLRFILRRLLYLIPTLFAISIVAFAIIQLPPGDYLTSVIAELSEQGADRRQRPGCWRCSSATGWASRSMSSTSNGSPAS